MAIILYLIFIVQIGNNVLGSPLKNEEARSFAENIHQHMTHHEVKRTFGVEHPDGIPQYDTFSGAEMRAAHEKRNHRDNKFTLRALDQDFEIELDPNDHIPHAGHVVEFYRSDGTVTRSLVDRAKHSTGRLVNDAQSAVTLSDTNGMSGVIHTKKETYVVNPIPPRLAAHSKRGHDHVIYRASTKDKNFAREAKCGVEEQFHQEKRERTSSYKRGSSANQKKKTMELMVAGDKSMVDFFGKEFLQTYLISMMNIAAGLYVSPSLEYPLHIAVVRVLMFEEEVFEGITSIQELLDKWGEWVNAEKAKMTAGDDDPLYADNAVLVSRKTCEGSCSIAGLAYFGTCSNSAQTVIKDNGLESALTVAHELGHNLRTNHDSQADASDCEDLVNIMSTSMTSGYSAFQWSQCASDHIAGILSDDSLSSCFDDEPAKVLNDVNSQLYGLIYTPDKQCEMAFGVGFTTCPSQGTECSKLLCKLPTSESCIVSPYPLSNGSPCGKSMWCMESECVPEVLSSDGSPINGGWSEWSDYTTCNRDCGVGVQYRIRECNNPSPSILGKDCIGESTGQHKTCYTHDCSSTESFREEQCKDKEADSSPIVNYKSPCQLFCGVGGAGKYYGYAKPGTACPNSNQICIHNECKLPGCDGKVESGKANDRCGVCDGDGSTCAEKSGKSDKPFDSQGDHLLVKIPAGSSNIVIQELAASINFLGVKVDGQYVIGLPSYSASATIGSASMVYDMDDFSYADKITISGQIEKDIEVYVANYYGGTCKGITWAYYEAGSSSASDGEWMSSSWGSCSKTCGGGIQTRSVACSRSDDGSTLSDSFCDSASKPSTTKDCDNDACPPSWYVSEYSECSESCGGGTKTRSVTCSQQNGDGSYSEVDASQCSGDKPSDSTSEVCNDYSCPARYEVGDWGQCCSGEQSRMVSCMRSDAEGQDLVRNAIECTKLTKPASTQSCSGNDAC